MFMVKYDSDSRIRHDAVINNCNCCCEIVKLIHSA